MQAARARAFELLGKAEAATQEYEAAARIILEMADTVPDEELKQGFLADPAVSAVLTHL